MREIKFRGRVLQPQYNLSTQKNETPMIKGSLVINEEMYCIYPTGQTNGYFVEKETVGQFTGLKDKNGVEIYEGDILQFNDKISWYAGTTVEWWQMNKEQRIKWLEEQPYPTFTVQYNLDEAYGISVSEAQSWEVIGNIHEGENK